MGWMNRITKWEKRYQLDQGEVAAGPSAPKDATTNNDDILKPNGDKQTVNTDSTGGGYVDELHRGIGLWGTLATSFAQQGVMASTTLLFGYGLSNGGPAVMLQVWIIGSFFSIIVGFCLAEICSKMPQAGSVYNWAGQLSKREESAVISYSTGWLNFLGNAASSVGYSFGFGQFVAALYDINADVPLSLGMQVLAAMLGTIVMAMVRGPLLPPYSHYLLTSSHTPPTHPSHLSLSTGEHHSY